jgi:flagellin
VQAGNTGTQDASSLKAINGEIQKLNSQLDNIASQTKFGATNLLDGSFNKNFQVGANGGDTIGLDLSSSDVTSSDVGGNGAGGVDLTALKIVGTAVAGTPVTYTPPTTYATADATADLATIDSAISKISSARSGIGATQNQLNYTVTNLQTAITNVTASRSNLTDADLASEVTKMTQSQILTQAATSVLAQANSAPQAILKLLQ